MATATPMIFRLSTGFYSSEKIAAVSAERECKYHSMTVAHTLNTTIPSTMTSIVFICPKTCSANKNH